MYYKAQYLKQAYVGFAEVVMMIKSCPLSVKVEVYHHKKFEVDDGVGYLCKSSLLECCEDLGWLLRMVQELLLIVSCIYVSVFL